MDECIDIKKNPPKWVEPMNLSTSHYTVSGVFLERLTDFLFFFFKAFSDKSSEVFSVIEDLYGDM